MQLKLENGEAKANVIQSNPETTVIRVVPAFEPLNGSKMSLLEEFRLLRGHRVSLYMENSFVLL